MQCEEEGAASVNHRWTAAHLQLLSEVTDSLSIIKSVFILEASDHRMDLDQVFVFLCDLYVIRP